MASGRSITWCRIGSCRSTISATARSVVRRSGKRTATDPLSLPDPAADAAWREFRWDGVTGVVASLSEAVRGHGKEISAAVFPTPGDRPPARATGLGTVAARSGLPHDLPHILRRAGHLDRHGGPRRDRGGRRAVPTPRGVVPSRSAARRSGPGGGLRPRWWGRRCLVLRDGGTHRSNISSGCVGCFDASSGRQEHESTKARKHESTKARKHESTKARKHESTKAEKARKHESTKAGTKHESTKARKHESTKARKHDGKNTGRQEMQGSRTRLTGVDTASVTASHFVFSCLRVAASPIRSWRSALQ